MAEILQDLGEYETHLLRHTTARESDGVDDEWKMISEMGLL